MCIRMEKKKKHEAKQRKRWKISNVMSQVAALGVVVCYKYSLSALA